MNGFLTLIQWLVTLSVVFHVVSNYLIINKLWSRRAVKEVSESISISAALLGLATGFPFLVHFTFVEQDVAPAIRQFISLGTGVVFVLIASGLFVSEYRGRSFFKLLMGALHLEKSESADLLRSLVQPTGAKELLRVFEAMASVDKHIDAREIEMIEGFAKRWRVDAPKLTEGVAERGGIVALRRSVEEYLRVSPPAEQAQELLDVLRMFVQADAHVSPEEDLVMEEISGMVGDYAGTGEGGRMFEVVIVPQSDEQTESVRSLLPGVEPKPARGGTVFSAGQFFSPRYAEAVCEKYIRLGLFTARVDA